MLRCAVLVFLPFWASTTLSPCYKVYAIYDGYNDQWSWDFSLIFSPFLLLHYCSTNPLLYCIGYINAYMRYIQSRFPSWGATRKLIVNFVKKYLCAQELQPAAVPENWHVQSYTAGVDFRIITWLKWFMDLTLRQNLSKNILKLTQHINLGCHTM